MKIFKDRNIGIILAACIATYIIYLTVEYIVTGGQLGVPLDDSWIHFRFAENFANGDYFQFNPGEPTSGTTSPLWVVLLAGFSFISSNYIFNSVFLSAVFHMFSCVFVYLLGVKIFSKKDLNIQDPHLYALIAALLTVLTGRFDWAGLSGMETTMFAFFSIAGIYMHVKDFEKNSFSIYPAILLSLATVSRPEGFLLFSLYMFDVVINLIRNKTLGKNIIKLGSALVIFAIISFPYLIFSYYTSGHFFPNTYRGQGGGFTGLPNLEYVKATVWFFLQDNLLTAFICFGAFIFYITNIKRYFKDLRLANLIYLWVFLLPIVSAFMAPNWRHHGRYIIPILPLINLVVVFSVLLYREETKRQKLKKILFNKKFFAIVSAFSIIYYCIFAANLGYNTGNIQDQQINLANWVMQNVPKNDVIALNDIGAITFLSDNKIVDMAGLVTPEILRYRTYNWDDNLDSTYILLKKSNVKYLIIYDNWFSKFLDKYGNHFEHIHSAILKNNTICGGDTMKVYKANLY